MPRGRLIFPFLCDIYQLDTAQTEADPDGAGELISGYDETFREPESVLADPTDQMGASARVESGPIQVLAQIEPDQFERLQMMLSGDSSSSRFSIVLHFKNLEEAGLVDDDGNPTIRKNDRLGAIRDYRRGTLIQNITNPPGLFVVEVQSRGFGLGPNRNLCLVVFEERERSVASG